MNEMTRAQRVTHIVRRSVGPSIVGAFGTQGALIITGVASARLLGVEGRGTFASISLIAYLSSFFGALSTAQVGRLLVAQGFDVRTVRSLVSRAASVPVVIAVLGSAIAASLLTQQPQIAIGSAAATALLITNSRSLGLLQGGRRYWSAAAQQLCAPVAFAVALLIAAVIGDPHVDAIVLSWLIGLLVASALGRVLLFRTAVAAAPAKGARLPTAREVLLRGAAGTLSTYSPLDSLRIDQLFVVLTLGSTALGLWVTAVAFSNLARLVGQAFSSLVPTVMQRPCGAHARVAQFACLSLAAGACVGFIGPSIVVPVFGEDFTAAAHLVLPLSLIGGLLGTRTVLAEALRARQREGSASWSEVASLLIFIGTAAGSMQLNTGLGGVVVSLLLAVCVGVLVLVALLRRASLKEAAELL